MNIRILGTTSFAAALLASAALAHHSFAMFDAAVTSHVGGTVTNFEWINPHVWLHVNVVNDAGVEEEWSFEAGSVRQLQTSFWEADSVQPGDVLSDVAFHPLKDGSNGGQLLEVVKADGAYLCQGPECRERQERERAGGGDQSQAVPDPEAIPSFAGLWQRNDQPFMQFLPPESGQGPLREDPAHARTAGDQLPFIGDASDPLLLPWASEKVADTNRRQLEAGEVILPAHSLCWPSGVPAALRLREPLQFLQEEDEVTLIYQRDHQVRRIRLNQPHSANPPNNWYGESIGHYEGDTLVVDTIGLNDRTTTDWYGTPHTESIHVVERYRIVDGGNTLEVRFNVSDPGAYTRPWSAIVHYGLQPARVQFQEIVCAENNKDASTGGDYPVPMADLARTAF
jgi:hypothetical protein